MKTWKFENYTVNEVEFDGDLHALEFVRDDDKYLGLVVASCDEDMDATIKALDEGEDPMVGWEDGNGNNVTIDGWARLE